LIVKMIHFRLGKTTSGLTTKYIIVGHANHSTLVRKEDIHHAWDDNLPRSSTIATFNHYLVRLPYYCNDMGFSRGRVHSRRVAPGLIGV
jgi:hypothetical protein